MSEDENTSPPSQNESDDINQEVEEHLHPIKRIVRRFPIHDEDPFGLHPND